MNSVLDEILRSGVVRDQAGIVYPLRSNVDLCEGRLLSELIESDSAIKKTLEVGCAYGISSLYICTALSHRSSPKHVIVDPFQRQEWKGIGILNLERAGYRFFELIETPSEFALPEIAKHESGTFDLIFIDGWHTFDHTLLDLFYADRLTKIGGYIVIDDCNWSSVAKAVSYISRYPSYTVDRESRPPINWKRAAQKIMKTIVPASIAPYLVPLNWYDRFYVRTLFSNMVALRKVTADDRNFDWFRPF
jgi:predicted O-methyltransferase YrrM